MGALLFLATILFFALLPHVGLMVRNNNRIL
jgi:hypothetical protein